MYEQLLVASLETATTGLRVPVDHAAIGQAAQLPTGAAGSIMSVSPVVLPVPGRAVDLQMRVTVPVAGDALPVLLLSHGHGPSNNLSSLNGYGPLANFLAARGFVVIQPTHLSSRWLGLDPASEGGPLFWRSRVEDMKHILDGFERIEAAVPGLAGRVDRTRIAVAGHSMGGHTAGMLLGARLTDADGSVVDLAEPRIKAGVLLTPPGDGGQDLSAYAFEHYTFLRHPDFSTMRTPALVVIGADDLSPHLSVRGPDWHADPYRLSPGPKSLLTVTGAWHGLGGISGYDAAETQDESPERLEMVLRMTLAYLRSALYPGDAAWPRACAALEGVAGLGTVESR